MFSFHSRSKAFLAAVVPSLVASVETVSVTLYVGMGVVAATGVDPLVTLYVGLKVLG